MTKPGPSLAVTALLLVAACTEVPSEREPSTNDAGALDAGTNDGGELDPPPDTRVHWGRSIAGVDATLAAGVAKTNDGLLVVGAFAGSARPEPDGMLETSAAGGLYAVTYTTAGDLAEARVIATLSQRAPDLTHFSASAAGAFAMVGRLRPETSGDVVFGPSSVTFGAGSTGVTISAAPQTPLYFVAGWGADGQFRWALESEVELRGLVVLPDGSTWIAGLYEAGDAFGGASITPDPPDGESRIFLARIMPNGAVGQLVGTSIPVSYEMSTREVLVGTSAGLVMTLGRLVTKFGFDGAPQWQTEYDNLVTLHAASARDDGSLLILGGATRLPSVPFNSGPFPYFGEWLFVEELSAEGARMGRRTVGTRTSRDPIRVAAASAGGFVVGGHAISSFVLGSEDRQRSYTSQGRRAFVAEFDAQGEMLWARTAAAEGALSRLEVHGLAVASDGAPVLCGVVLEPTSFSEGDWTHQFNPGAEPMGFVVKLIGTGDDLQGEAPRILRFERSEDATVGGGSVDLHFEVEGATLVDITSVPEGFNFATEVNSGQLPSGPLQASSRFVLTAIGPGGATTAEAAVAVEPADRVIRAGLRAPFSLATDGASFVFVEMRETYAYDIVSVSPDGSVYTTLAAGEAPTRELVADEQGVYWLAEPAFDEPLEVRTLSSGGGAETFASTSGSFAESLALTESHVYWRDHEGARPDSRVIVRAARDGSAGREILVGGLADNSGVFSVAGDHLYYTRAIGFEVTLFVRNLETSETSTVTVLPVELGHPHVLVADGEILRLGLSPQSGGLRIASVPILGGAPSILAESAGNLSGLHLPVDEAFIYWTERYPEVRAMRAPRLGGLAELLAGYDSFEAQTISSPLLMPNQVAWLLKGLPLETGGSLVSVSR